MSGATQSVEAQPVGKAAVDADPLTRLEIKPASGAYRHDGEHHLVEISLRNVRQLFNNMDPAPFRERDLDDEAEGYIVSAMRELGSNRPTRLVFHVSQDGLGGESAASVETAVRHYFEYRSRHAAEELRRLLMRGIWSLLIGLAFLFGCLWLRTILQVTPERSATDQILTEGLLIMGWVALWRPMEIFLYDWWPFMHRKRLLRHIADMPMTVASSPS